MHDLEVIFLPEFRMAYRAQIPLVFFDQESFVGSVGRMASCALPFRDGRMNDRPGKLFPYFGMAGTAHVLFSSDEAERIRPVGRLVAVRTELLCHGHMRNCTGQCLFRGRMGIVAVGTALFMDRIVGMRFSESPCGTIVTLGTQIGGLFFQEAGLR